MPRQSGTTPLHMAAYGNNVPLLLDNLMMGVDVNSVNRVSESLHLRVMMPQVIVQIGLYDECLLWLVTMTSWHDVTLERCYATAYCCIRGTWAGSDTASRQGRQPWRCEQCKCEPWLCQFDRQSHLSRLWVQQLLLFIQISLQPYPHSLLSGWQCGGTPLHNAAHEGKVRIIGILLDKGANVNALNNVSRETVVPRDVVSVDWLTCLDDNASMTMHQIRSLYWYSLTWVTYALLMSFICRRAARLLMKL